MMNSIIEMFSYTFMVKAFICGILISFSAALIGVTLVLRRNSMIGDGLSHVAFGAFAIATVLGFAPLVVSIPVVIIASILLLRLNENSKINGDAGIALISASALAIGTFVVSITKGVNIDINNYLFGSVLSIGKEDIYISVALSILVIFLYIFSYNKIFAITFDEKFASSIGINTRLYNIIFASICSVVVVLGMRLMGSLLISSLIIFPTTSSREIFKTFKGVVIVSSIISVLAFIIGLSLSYFISTPAGSTIVLVNLVIFIIFKIVGCLLISVKRHKKAK